MHYMQSRGPVGTVEAPGVPEQPLPDQPLSFSSVLVDLHIPYHTQSPDAVHLFLEQINLIHCVCASYSELELVTSPEGRCIDGLD